MSADWFPLQPDANAAIDKASTAAQALCIAIGLAVMPALGGVPGRPRSRHTCANSRIAQQLDTHLLCLLGVRLDSTSRRAKTAATCTSALAAGDGERDYHTLTDLEPGVTLADLVDLAHGLVPKHVMGVHFWDKSTHQMKVYPQIAQAVTLMMTSRSSSMIGSSTCSQRMSLLPCQVSAF